MYAHPQYVGLFVYEGKLGEKPKAAAFFKPKQGMTLTQVSWNAYGAGHDKLVYARKINGNSWNMEMGRAGIVIYRNSDTNCNAAKVPPDSGPGAASANFGTSPWIAQCPTADPGQVFWIPPKDDWDKRPEDLSAKKPFKPPTMTFTAPEKFTPPTMAFIGPGTPGGGGRTYDGGTDDGGSPEVPEDPNRKWWIIGGIAIAVVAAGAGIYAWKRKK